MLLRAAAGVSAQPASAAAPREGFVTANGIRLHYVDWGGSGDALVFLLPNGGSLLRQFDALAPQFTDRFRVLGITRRGLGQSDKPSTGYDTDTLARDIAGFLDALHISRANLASHSIGGAEMTRFAVLYPQRVVRLVYLDSAIDYAQLNEIAREARLPPPPDRALAATAEGAGKNHPEYSKVMAPALDVAVVYDGPFPTRPEDDDSYKRYARFIDERDFIGDQIRQFRQHMKRGEILTLHHTDHNAFLHDPAQLRIVVPKVREFLSAK
ncbi:MAG TPA: alpha/beta hydrolase [Vicinamibacterales bacterium]|nr:alpha/beta hydrolase [Vicinamibacterales bacterium]